MSQIHPTAIVEDGAKIGEGVEIGPFCVIGSDVELHANVTLKSHVVVQGKTEIGEGTVIFPFSSIGHQPQDLKYKGEPSRLVIGKRNVIRENVTMNPGTEGGGMVTTVGDDCLIMVGAHVAHDCIIGNHVILVNNATLAGHVVVEDFAICGGLSAVHQFVRIGRHAMIGGMTGVEKDVIPYGSVMGNRAWLAGLNLVGAKRRGMSRDEISRLRAAHKQLFADDGTLLADRIDAVAEAYADFEPVMEIVAFMRADSSRKFCTPQAAGQNGA